jgi:SSS family transporter
MDRIDPTLVGVFIVLYVAIQIGVGLYVARGVKTEEDFFLAGRKLGLVPIALSIFATWFGAETIMGSAGAIADEGLSGARAEPFGYAICLFAMAFLVAGVFRARGYRNLADFFRDRFDHRSELATALITIVVSTIWAAAQLLALSALLEIALGVPAHLTLAGATLVVIVYTSFAGIAGDIYTDMIQSVVLIVGLVLVLVSLASAMGGFGPMLASIEPSQLRLLGDGETWLGQIDAWAIPVLGSLITQEAISRFLSTRSPELARQSTLAAGALYLLLGMVPVVIALAGVHYMAVGEDADAFLPALAEKILSPVVYILFAGALLSAVMSTTNSNVLSVSSMMSLNVLSQLHARATDKTRVQVARWTTVGAGLAAWAIAASGQSIYELIALTSVWGQAGILVAVLIGLWSPYGGKRAALWAILACVAVNLWTLAFAPLFAEMRDGASFGDAFGLLIEGEAETMEGYFLLSLVVSLVAYAAGAEMDKLDRPAVVVEEEPR